MTLAASAFELTIDGTARGSLGVTSFSVRERMSELFAGSVEAVTARMPQVDALPGRRCSLAVHMTDGSSRRWHGVVLEASLDAPRRDLFRLQVDFGPRASLLRLGRDARAFQKKSAREVAKAVLDGAGLTGAAQQWSVTASLPKRPWVAQYNESDWDFVARLVAEEGIGFFVRNGESAEELVFFDDGGAFTNLDGVSVLVDRDGTALAVDTVTELRDRRRGASDAVVLRDYDFQRPALDLTVREEAPSATGREVYLHPGRYLETAVGRRLARRLLEGLRSGARVMHGDSDVARLEPGRVFTLEGHARAASNGEFLVIGVEHRGSSRRTDDGIAIAYDNSFKAVPRDGGWRPARGPVVPEATGVQVAFVTAPGSEEIHTDASGRVKVRFPWDRSGVTDDQSSHWLRVGQLALGGSMVLPRRGFEVIVDHELGDRDRPYVSGHLYNGDARPPYALPAGAARSAIQSATTPGGGSNNELRFDDTAGAEEVFLDASKDMVVSVENSASFSVAVDESVSIGANHVVQVAANLSANVKTDRALSVGGSQSHDAGGAVSDAVGGSLTHTVGGNLQGTCGGDLSEATTGALTRKVGSMSCVMGIAHAGRKVVGDSSTSVGAAWVEIAAQSRQSQCGGARSETTGGLRLVKAKSYSVSAGAAIVITCAANAVKCGGGRTDGAQGAVVVNAGGGWSVKATGLTLEAKSRLVVRAGACVIQLSSSGKVLFKAPTIDLSGVKALGQITHRSN